MTSAEEKENVQVYRGRIGQLLAEGTPDSCRKLSGLCSEGRYLFLMRRDRELLLFWRVMCIYDRECAAGVSFDCTIFGRTAAFLGIATGELAAEQLTAVYTIVKFAVLRLDSALPAELVKEGFLRAAAWALSETAVAAVAEYESASADRVIAAYREVLQ